MGRGGEIWGDQVGDDEVQDGAACGGGGVGEPRGVDLLLRLLRLLDPALGSGLGLGLGFGLGLGLGLGLELGLGLGLGSGSGSGLRLPG